jgi:hypothetical protein
MTSILKVDTIQDADGNNIINESGNTITIGASGDNITIPSGATFTSVGIDDNADATAITIDSSERVGIGTTTPGVKLEIKGADGDADAQAIRLMENSTQGGFIKYDGNVNELQLGGFNSGENTGIRIARNDATTHFNTNGSERMRINSNGNIQIGTTTESARLHIASTTTAGTDPLVVFSDASGTDCGSIDLNASGNTVAYTTSSDYRLKENVSYDFDATTRLKQLKPARFNFIADADTTVDGFLAHEVSSVVPEAITGEKDAVKIWKEGEELPEGVSVGDNKLDENGNTIIDAQGIDQSKLVPLLVKTIQELEARITTLETKVQTLENNQP